jgi:hypothetical protein
VCFERSAKRAAKEAKALRRKAERHGDLEGRDASRYKRLRDQATSEKYAAAAYTTALDNDDEFTYNDWD